MLHESSVCVANEIRVTEIAYLHVSDGSPLFACMPHFVGFVSIYRRDPHRSAFGGQAQRNTAPDPTSTPRDDGYFAFEPSCLLSHVLSFERVAVSAQGLDNSPYGISQLPL
jgi:hypothetical protein